MQKKVIQIRGGETLYQAPEMEIIETQVESGFAASDWNDGSVDDEDNNLGSY